MKRIVDFKMSEDQKIFIFSLSSFSLVILSTFILFEILFAGTNPVIILWSIFVSLVLEAVLCIAMIDFILRREY